MVVCWIDRWATCAVASGLQSCKCEPAIQTCSSGTATVKGSEHTFGAPQASAPYELMWCSTPAIVGKDGFWEEW